MLTSKGCSAAMGSPRDTNTIQEQREEERMFKGGRLQRPRDNSWKEIKGEIKLSWFCINGFLSEEAWRLRDALTARQEAQTANYMKSSSQTLLLIGPHCACVLWWWTLCQVLCSSDFESRADREMAFGKRARLFVACVTSLQSGVQMEAWASSLDFPGPKQYGCQWVSGPLFATDLNLVHIKGTVCKR